METFNKIEPHELVVNIEVSDIPEDPYQESFGCKQDDYDTMTRTWTELEYNEYLKLIHLLNDYEFIHSSIHKHKYFAQRRQHKNKYLTKSQESKKEVKWEEFKLQEFIPLYKPLTSHRYYQFWEIAKHFNLAEPKKKNFSVFNISTGVAFPSFCEVIARMREKYSPYSHKDVYWQPIIIPEWNIIMKNKAKLEQKQMKILSNNYGIQFISFGSKYFDIAIPKHIVNLINNFTSIDLIVAEDAIGTAKMGSFHSINDFQILFNQITIAFGIQKKGGTFLLRVFELCNDPINELIYLLRMYYDKVHIYSPEISKPLSPEKYLVCFGFKGINEKRLNSFVRITQELYKIDEHGGRYLHVSDETTKGKAFRKKFQLTQAVEDKDVFKFVNSLFDIPKKELKHQRDIIKNFNNNFYPKIIGSHKKLFDLHDKLKHMNKEETNTFISKRVSEQVRIGVAWARKYDVVVNPVFDMSTIKDTLGKEIKRMKAFDLHYGKDKHKLPPLKELTYNKKNKFEYLKFNVLKRRLNLYRRIMDPLDEQKLRFTLGKIDVYRPLKFILQKEYGIKNVTNAWLKIYELVSKFDIIPRGKEIKSFHICEMPGAFILGIDHYIRKNMKGSTFNWKSQSLNPYSEYVKKHFDGLGDQFNLVTDNPDKWFFGKDNTGNIMNEKNMKYYHKKIKDIDFVTGDCGVHIEGRAFNEQEIFESKLNYSQVLMMLHVLPKGKNFVIKTFLPFSEPSTISWIYLLYCLFENLFILKPLTSRPANSEIYIIGYNFSGISDEYLTHLRSVLKKYTYTKGIFRADQIPEDFLDSLYQASEYFINQQVEALKKVLYYYERPQDIEKHVLPTKKLMITNWLKTYGLYRTNKKRR